MTQTLASPPPARRILVIRLGAIGDVVRTRVAFASLRELYPAAEIDWLVDDRCAAALDGLAGVADVVRFPRHELSIARPLASLRALTALARRLRERGYDLCVDFHGILKSGTLALLSGAPLRVGYAAPVAREESQRFLTHRIRVEPEHLSRFERNQALVRALGASTPARAPALWLAPELEQALGELPAGFFALHPGTSESTRYKRWDPMRYASLARRLRDESAGLSLVTWGDIAERACAEQVVASAGGAARLAPSTPSIAHLLALLRRARVFVGSDSGPMHLASLAGTPVVALFGPTDPVENAPYAGVPFRILREDVGCNPCRAGCPARTCMQSIEIEPVVRAVLDLVARAEGVH